MPSPTPARPSPATLASRRVDEPVSSAHGRRWAQELNHLRAYAVPPVLDARLPLYAPTSTETSDVWVLYRRTPGVQVIRVSAEVLEDTTASGQLSLRAGATPSLVHFGADEAPLGPADSPWNGAASSTAGRNRRRALSPLVAYFDVSSWPTTLLCLRLRYLGASGEAQLLYARVAEVPLASVNPAGDPTNEPGCNEAEPDVRNRIYQGVSGGPGGLRRMFDELDVARAEVRRHAGLATRTVSPFTRNSLAMGGLSYDSVPVHPRIRMRARRLYGAGTLNRYTFAAVYIFNPTYTADLTLSRIRATASTIGLGGATVSTPADIPIENTVLVPKVGTAAIDVPCDGDDQVAEVTFGAQTANSPDGVTFVNDEVRILALALIENEA